MAEMFGLSSPVPQHDEDEAEEEEHAAAEQRRDADARCAPTRSGQPPMKIARRRPSSRSAIQPPGSDARYTDAA